MPNPFKGITLNEGENDLGNFDVNITKVEQPIDKNYIYNIKGTVTSTNPEHFSCLVYSDLEVKIYKIKFGIEPEYIQSTTVNNDGKFTADIETTSSTILIRLYRDSGTAGISPTLLGESPKLCHNDRTDVPFNIDESIAGDPVFDVVVSRIAGEGVNTSEMISGLTPEQINELSCITCVNEKTISKIKNAYSLWHEFSTMPPPDNYTETAGPWDDFKSHPDTATADDRGRKILFALLNGKNNNLGDVFAYSRDQFDAALVAAQVANEVQGGLNSSTNLDDLVGVRDALLLNSSDDGRYNDGKLIHLSDNTYADKSNLLDNALANGGLLGIPASTPPDAHLQAALNTKVLSETLLNYTPFVAAFIAARGHNIDYFDLAAAGPGGLETLITSSGALPAGYATAAEYAAAIYQDLGNQEPSGRMAYALSGAGSSIPNSSNISSLLSSNKDFNIKEHSAAVFFTTDAGQPNTISQQLMDDTLTLQRASRLAGDTNSLGTTATLIGLNLASSSAIVNMGEATFLRTLNGTGTISPDTANAIFSTARGVNEAASMMALNYLRYEGPNALMPRSLRGDGLSLPGGSLPPNLPNMQTLFGSLNTCACEECQSVYGAAAYLTDLLNWLRKDVVNPASPFQTGLDALETMGAFDRRKDIRYLLLTCQNTNTLVPYIDIVNEILSVELLADAGQTQAQILAARQSLQTTKTADEIRIQPEHRFTLSENLLRNYFYTWKLPYNVPFDEVLSYTALSGMTYPQMVTDFSPPNLKYDEIRWARALLNINSQELSIYDVFNSGATSFWLTYWGSNSAITTVGPVLKVTGLSISELKAELNAYYINGSAPIQLVPTTDLCNVDTYTFSPAFTAAVAERLMRLYRLRRRAALSVWEMDVAIATFSGAGAFMSDAFLQKFAASISFSNEHNIEFGDLMVMMGDFTYNDLITPANFSEYYNNKFLNPLLPLPIVQFFTTAPYPTNVDSLTNEQKHFLATTMDTSIFVINSILNYAPLALTGSFTTAKLATIHRHVLLLKTFGLDYTELADAITFFGDIFNATNKIKAAYNFSESISRFRLLDVPLLQFMDVTNGTGDHDLASTVLDGLAQTSWENVEKAFQEARKANPDKDATLNTWLNFYKAVLVQEFAIQFDMLDADVDKIINEYSNTWFSSFIADPDGVTPRIWNNKSTAYKPVFRLLQRIVLLCEILGIEKTTVNELEKQSLIYGIETEISPITKNVPGTEPFYWLKNNFTALTAAGMSDLVWIKNASRQAALLDMVQRDVDNVLPLMDFYIRVDDFFNNFSTYVIAPNSPIYTLYDALGENSVYKKLSIHEFSEIFIRARSIATANNDFAAVLDAFEKIYNVTQIFKIKAADAWGWVWASGWDIGNFIAATNDYTMSADIRRAVNSKYTSLSTWKDAIVPVQDGLRERMRDAFVGLYIAQKGFADENKLYDYYLIDTQVAACMDTSRIVQAISSVQLLVNRGLLNLEVNVFMDEEDKQEWEWRKNYRVWQANRKVFLYPENWIDPTLRKNKTELFKAAEELLQQDDINDSNCELAYSNYLNGLNDVAHLDTRAIYVEDPTANLAAGGGMVYNNNPNEIYHVFARNWNAPYIYYYRKFEEGVWQGWQKMDIEIDSDHLVPVMFNRKIYLFFSMFKDKVYEWKNNSGDPKDTILAKYYEISLAYTKFDFGKWSQKKIFNETIFASQVAWANGAFYNDPVPKIQKDWSKWWFGGSNLPNSSYIKAVTHYAGLYYAVTSMEKKDFYFWAENLSNGGLKIHCRRAFDMSDSKTKTNIDSYSEFAFEMGFSLNQVDERANIIGDGPISPANDGTTFFLARPYMTVPWFQQMKQGKAWDKPGGLPGLFAKKVATSDPLAGWPLLNNASDFILTFPQQYEHNYWKQPFFFKHPIRSYFFKAM